MTFEFDLGLSFLSCDLLLAQQLAHELVPLRCFVYSRSQDEVAGTDGVETFAAVFKKKTLLNVVLWRAGWGDTPWTAIEAAAIRDRALLTAYKTLVIIDLDGSPPPPWVPHTHIAYSLSQFGAKEAVGVLRARALEAGASSPW